ncbi:MAG TPA: hypothetical protein VIP11_17335 [Gemmatimonadaceae bacterium]
MLRGTQRSYVIGLLVFLSLGACGDLTAVPASLSNFGDTTTVYALNGAPTGASTAFYVYGGSPVAADASFFFDIAFEIAGPGQVTILPLRTVASGYVSTHAVGLATVSQTYEFVESVSKETSFRADTAMTVARDQVVLVQVDESASVCASATTGSYIYAKVVVRSIDQDKRTMQIEYTVNPNCGFRSFASGIPTFLARPQRAAN